MEKTVRSKPLPPRPKPLPPAATPKGVKPLTGQTGPRPYY